MDTEAKVIPAPHHGFIEKKRSPLDRLEEAPWTPQTAGLAPGHYSATENVLVLLLNVLGKSLHNICIALQLLILMSINMSGWFIIRSVQTLYPIMTKMKNLLAYNLPQYNLILSALEVRVFIINKKIKLKTTVKN